MDKLIKHIEDYNLFSVNYHHYGAPKIWYATNPEQAYKVQPLLELYNTIHCKNWCQTFMSHKNFIVDPLFLLHKGIQMYKVLY